MKRSITLAHSPDPDDAFMWWPLIDIDGSGPSIDVGEYEFQLITKDIEQLNCESERGSYDITAMSIAHYPSVASQYVLTACGASLGDGYGPKIVASEKVELNDLLSNKPNFAVPGERTSALAALRILADQRPLEWCSIDFAEIMNEVKSKRFDAGVVIHEGQLTYEQHGLYEICDLGKWWKEETSLPLPLGGNAVKRDIETRFGDGAVEQISTLLLNSIEYALSHREQALNWAIQWGRGIDIACTDTFVDMYVNKWTLDFGDVGKRAVQEFLSRVSKVGAISKLDEIVMI